MNEVKTAKSYACKYMKYLSEVCITGKVVLCHTKETLACKWQLESPQTDHATGIFFKCPEHF